MQKRNINYGIIKFKITTSYPKKKDTINYNTIEWVYVGDTLEEVNSLIINNVLKDRIKKRLNLKDNQAVSIVKVNKLKNISKTTYEV